MKEDQEKEMIQKEKDDMKKAMEESKNGASGIND